MGVKVFVETPPDKQVLGKMPDRCQRVWHMLKRFENGRSVEPLAAERQWIHVRQNHPPHDAPYCRGRMAEPPQPELEVLRLHVRDDDAEGRILAPPQEPVGDWANTRPPLQEGHRLILGDEPEGAKAVSHDLPEREPRPHVPPEPLLGLRRVAGHRRPNLVQRLAPRRVGASLGGWEHRSPPLVAGAEEAGLVLRRAVVRFEVGPPRVAEEGHEKARMVTSG